MRIAYITQWWPPEGATIVASLARELSRRGHQLDVVTGFPNYPSGKIYDGYRLRWRQIEHSDGFRTIRVPLYPSHDRSALKRVANYASFGVAASTIGVAHLGRPDVAYVYHPPITSAWPVRVLRRLRGVPFVLHIQDLWPESVVHSGMVGEGRRSRRIEAAIERMTRAAYRAAAHIVVISPGFKERLIARGVPSRKITVIMNWADETIFKPTKAAPEVRAQLGPQESRLVIYGGNLGDFQGLETPVRVAARFRGRGIHLVLIGDGLARHRLESLILELGIQNVSILPPRSPTEIQPFLAAADAHLVSLRDLSFFDSTIPGKTQVAMAMGKPMIASLRGDGAHLVERSRSGFTCAPGEEALCRAFERFLCCSPEDLDNMGNNGYHFYKSNLSLKAAGVSFENIFDRSGQ
ncbi:MAG TPA: glycosyltransferase family 4 protein [Acidimicrobiales bacterium]|nr:glycosyltransferase family 4 protein [Acidimicrobiales bacterium]